MRYSVFACFLLVAACSSDAVRLPASPSPPAARQTQTTLATDRPSSAQHQNAPYLVVDNVRFVAVGGAPGCEAVLANVTNLGDAVQPFGWTWTLEIPKAHISATFVGQQPLAPGETRVLAHNPGSLEPGTYRVKISIGSDDGRTKGAGAILRVLC